MIDILLNEQNTLTVGLEVEGSSTKNMKTRLVIETGDGFDLTFEGKSYDAVTETVLINVPILGSTLVAGSYKSRLEVILDSGEDSGEYFIADESEINAVMPVSVKASIESSAKINKKARNKVDIKAKINVDKTEEVVEEEKEEPSVNEVLYKAEQEFKATDPDGLTELERNVKDRQMEYKLASGKDFEVKHNITEFKMSDEEEGVIEGVASAFGVLDSHNDIVHPGSFKRSINSGKRIMMLTQHKHGENPVGVWDSVYETPEGLMCKGRLNLDTQAGREIYSLAKMGALSGLSIGYSVEKADIRDRKGVRQLRSLNLAEISIVTFPSNPDTHLDSVKSEVVVEEAKPSALENALKDMIATFK